MAEAKVLSVAPVLCVSAMKPAIDFFVDRLGFTLTGSAGAAGANPFLQLRFPRAPLGLYDGRPWFLPLAEVWYKLLDFLT